MILTPSSRIADLLRVEAAGVWTDRSINDPEFWVVSKLPMNLIREIDAGAGRYFSRHGCRQYLMSREAHGPELATVNYDFPRKEPGQVSGTKGQALHWRFAAGSDPDSDSDASAGPPPALRRARRYRGNRGFSAECRNRSAPLPPVGRTASSPPTI